MGEEQEMTAKELDVRLRGSGWHRLAHSPKQWHIVTVCKNWRAGELSFSLEVRAQLHRQLPAARLRLAEMVERIEGKTDD